MFLSHGVRTAASKLSQKYKLLFFTLVDAVNAEPMYTCVDRVQIVVQVTNGNYDACEKLIEKACDGKPTITHECTVYCAQIADECMV